MRTVYDVAERVIMLDDGKIIFDGTPTDIEKSNDKIVQQFVKGDSTLI